MAGDKKTTITVDGDSSGYEAAMKRVEAASRSAFAGVNESIASASKPLQLLQDNLGKISALLAGGAAFKESIAATVEWGTEIGKLSREFQISTADATTLAVALERNGIGADVYESAFDKLTKQMVKSPEAFQKLGIATKDQNGAWLSGAEIMPEVIAKLQGITNETQQNIAGTKLFGRGWAEIRSILKLNAEEMATAAQRAKDLNLAVDPGQVKAYKKALADVHLITQSLQIQIGSALIPALTTMASYMGGQGASIAQGFKIVLQGIAAAAMTVWEGLTQIGQDLGALAAIAVAVATGQFSQVNVIIKERMTDAGAAVARLKELWKHAFDDPPKPPQTPEAGGGGPALDLDKDKELKSRMQQWQTELEANKAFNAQQAEENHQFYSMSKQDEEEYWLGILNGEKLSKQERQQVAMELSKIRVGIMTDEYNATIAGLKSQEDAYKNNYAARIDIAKKEAETIGSYYGLNSKEYEAAQGHITALQREAAAQAVKIENDKQDAIRDMQISAIEQQQTDVNQQYEMKEISYQQLIQAEKKFEDQITALRKADLAKKLADAEADPDRNPELVAKLNQQIEQLESQHQMKMAELSRKAAQDASKNYTSMLDTVQNSFETMFTSLANGTTKLQAAMLTLFESIGNAVIQMAAKTAAEWVMDQLRQKISAIANAMSQVNANAAVAGSAAFASTAAIPLVGPELAPAAAAASYAGALAYGAGITASAAGGYDIPSGVNPVTQLHQNEMVLPADLASNVRNMTGGGGHTFNISVQAMDAQSVSRLFNSSGSALVQTLLRQLRLGGGSAAMAGN